LGLKAYLCPPQKIQVSEVEQQKIKVGAVSYLNTKPLLFGMDKLPVRDMIELSTDYPSAVAGRLLEGTIDIGLVPVAVIPEMTEYYIDADFCIGATGPVASVCLFSQVPVAQIETVVLDYQSRTSVMLVQVLLRHFWKHKVKFVQAEPGFEEYIDGTTAAVVIGDRALQMRKEFLYVYDLAEAWKKFTGFPFVFAAWIANKPLPKDFMKAFNEANQYGLERLDEVIAQQPLSSYDLKHYYTQNISYVLDDEKRAGLQLFLKYVKELREAGQYELVAE
jgi:chorismate dehydratase